MTPAIAYVPDPAGAAVIIDTLNTLYNMHIDTQSLLEKADDIKRKLKEVAQRAQAMRRSEERRGTPEALYA
jgi:predicted ATP-grasp superfamily ATP-dependent carboligase